MISAIVAVDKDWGIGYQGQLLEHLPPDMKYFKELTMGNIVIMGRKTWDGLPVKPLLGRSNIILSRTLQRDSWIYDDEAHYIQFAPEVTEHDLKTFQNSSNHLFVIGGGEIYKQLLPYCDRVYVTFIEKSHDNVDTYFPNLDEDSQWEVSTSTELREYKDISYAFLTYDRIS
jgi:dihydrofolate reductase